MTRGRVALTVLAGILVFLAILVLYLPASWFGGMLPAGVRCGELGGSVWAGECLGLEVGGNRFGDATWNLSTGRVFTGRLVGDVEIRGPANARADLDLGFGGSGELRLVEAAFPLDPAFIPQLPANQRGQISATLQRVALADGRPREIEGAIQLRDLRQLRGTPAELGSYEVKFDGNVKPDGSLDGKLRDLGGPFRIEGTLTFTPPNAYVAQGFITGRTAEAERVVREITLGAAPDASGRSEFTFEGTF